MNTTTTTQLETVAARLWRIYGYRDMPEAGPARQYRVSLQVGSGIRIEWMPDEAVMALLRELQARCLPPWKLFADGRLLAFGGRDMELIQRDVERQRQNPGECPQCGQAREYEGQDCVRCFNDACREVSGSWSDLDANDEGDDTGV